MADEAARDPGPFDVQTIRQLVKLMSHHDLSEILLQQGDSRIRLRRGSAGGVSAAPHAMPMQLSTAAAAGPRSVCSPPKVAMTSGRME